ncbi:MAG: ABC transporter substrate-binding protein [Myxococcales bacterium]|nr:ABC transporter substrate-binding protein [Myxococcales bacterium]
MNSYFGNIIGLVICLVAAMGGVLLLGFFYPVNVTNNIKNSMGAPQPQVIVDARSREVPVHEYQRIVSINPVADQLLLDLVEPQRLVAITATNRRDHPNRWRFGDRVGIEISDMLAPVLALQPDLVVVSKHTDEALVSRWRENGIEVFDLGEMRGVQDTKQHILLLSKLLSVPYRGRRLTSQLMDSLTALEVALKGKDRVRGLYLLAIGDSFFGGTADTSYGDILHYGGIIDQAAESGYRGWPRYSGEQLVVMNPDLIVTRTGGKGIICRHESLRLLKACGDSGQIVELPRGLSDDPGLGVVEAARLLQQLVYD